MERERYEKANTINQEINSLRRNIESLQNVTEDSQFKFFGVELMVSRNSQASIYLNKDMIEMLVEDHKKKIKILEKKFESL